MRSTLLAGLTRPACSTRCWRTSRAQDRVSSLSTVIATRQLSYYPQTGLRSSLLQPKIVRTRAGDARCLSLGGWWSKSPSPAPDSTSTPVEPSPEVLAVAPADDTVSGAAASIPPSTPPSSQDAVMAATSSSSTSVEPLTSVSDATASATDATSSLTNTFASHAMQYGDMAALDLVHYSPAGFFPWLIEVTHVSTALPLWSVIIVTTLGARLFLLPFVIRATRTSARLAPLQPQLAEIRAKVDKARVERDTLLMQQAMLKQQSLFSKAGVNPFDQIFMSVLQIAVQFGFFIGLRRMCTAPVEQFKDGGFGFIMDLTAPDPYFILPVLNTILVNAQLTVSRQDMMATGTPAVPHIINGLRVFSLLGLPFMAFFPSAINLHLTTSISFIALQTIILRQASVRAKLGIPPRPAPLNGGVEKHPSIMDTVRYVRKWMKDKQTQATADAMERERKLRKATRGIGK